MNTKTIIITSEHPLHYKALNFAEMRRLQGKTLFPQKQELLQLLQDSTENDKKKHQNFKAQLSTIFTKPFGFFMSPPPKLTPEDLPKITPILNIDPNKDYPACDYSREEFERILFDYPENAVKDVLQKLKPQNNTNPNELLYRLSTIKHWLDPKDYRDLLDRAYKKCPDEALAYFYDLYQKNPDQTYPTLSDYFELSKMATALMAVFSKGKSDHQILLYLTLFNSENPNLQKLIKDWKKLSHDEKAGLGNQNDKDNIESLINQGDYEKDPLAAMIKHKTLSNYLSFDSILCAKLRRHEKFKSKKSGNQNDGYAKITYLKTIMEECGSIQVDILSKLIARQIIESMLLQKTIDPSDEGILNFLINSKLFSSPKLDVVLHKPQASNPSVTNAYNQKCIEAINPLFLNFLPKEIQLAELCIHRLQLYLTGEKEDVEEAKARRKGAIREKINETFVEGPPNAFQKDWIIERLADFKEVQEVLSSSEKADPSISLRSIFRLESPKPPAPDEQEGMQHTVESHFERGTETCERSII